MTALRFDEHYGVNRLRIWIHPDASDDKILLIQHERLPNEFKLRFYGSRKYIRMSGVKLLAVINELLPSARFWASPRFRWVILSDADITLMKLAAE